MTIAETGLSVQYDHATDVLTVEGVRYSGVLFRSLGICETGKWMKVVERKDGVLTVLNVTDELSRTFNAICEG